MRFLSLFSGIGGFDLGLERAGMECVGQVEIDPFCRAVLAKHWPNVKRMEDVRTVRGNEFGWVDVLAGGVPCQPSASGGRRLGKEDPRWLWPEYTRIVRVLRPDWLIPENPRGFLTLPDSRSVLRELEQEGYELGPLLLSAEHLGASHRRDRFWIVGYSDRIRQQAKIHEGELRAKIAEVPRDSSVGTMRTSWPPRPSHVDSIQVDPDGFPRGLVGFARRNALRALGNAVVPDVAEVIGRAIMAAHLK